MTAALLVVGLQRGMFEGRQPPLDGDGVEAGIQTDFCVDSACRAAFGLGYAVALVSDGHTTLGTPDLTATQVIAHDNRVLQRGGFVEPAEAAASKTLAHALFGLAGRAEATAASDPDLDRCRAQLDVGRPYRGGTACQQQKEECAASEHVDPAG